MKRSAIAVAFLLLGACASVERDAPPDWLDGSSETYPPQAYLVGIGSADDASSARDRARADLAKTFRVHIDASSRDVQRHDVHNDPRGTTSAYSSEIRRDLAVRTDQVLEGVSVPQSWQDPATGRYHALAVLNRARASLRLREDINGLDAAAESLLQRARVANDAFTRAKLAAEVVENQRRRAALQDMLRAVDASGRGLPPRWPLAQLIADLDTALARITLRAEGDDAWRDVLAGQLAAAGFQVGAQGDHAVRLDVNATTMRRDGWHWVRGSAVLNLRAPDGRTLGQQRWEIKESATDEQTARLRFRERVAEILASESRRALLGIATNDEARQRSPQAR